VSSTPETPRTAHETADGSDIPETHETHEIPETHRSEDRMTTDETLAIDVDDQQTRAPQPPARPTGPHLPPVLLGIICLAIAGLAMWQELGDVSLDWGNIGPLGIVAVGGLLVVLGLVGLLGSRRRTSD